MINKSVVTPLYIQIAEELRKEILDNKYGVSGCMDTQSQIAERFGVSLITVRKAIELLAEEGLVDIRRGKGTYVRKSTIVDPLQNLTGITHLMSRMNMEGEVYVPVFELRDTPEMIEEKDRCFFGEQSLFIRRITSVSGIPFANTDMYLPGKYESFLSRKEVEEKTVYRIYQDKLGINLGRGRQIIKAAGADEEVAKSLGIDVGAPVLRLERKAYDNQGNLIEYMELSYEASKYCFEVDLELSKQ